MKIKSIFLIALFACCFGCERKQDKSPQVKGLIPNAETAIKIAEAVWLPIYGDEIYDEKPFSASLTKLGEWVVLGSTHGKHGGGALMMLIQPKDGTIVFVGRDPGK